MTAVLLLAVVVLAAALAIVIALGRIDARAIDRLAAIRDRQRIQLDHKQHRIDALRAELEALSIAGPPPAAVAALTPDDPTLLPAEVEQWLRTRESR